MENHKYYKADIFNVFYIHGAIKSSTESIFNDRVPNLALVTLYRVNGCRIAVLNSMVIRSAVEDLGLT